jgi:type 1 glutamine amidotransferase
MKALVICDDYWHPARTVRNGLAPLVASGVAFDWIENSADWSAERMAAYPLVVLSKSNNVSSSDRNPWMTEEVQQAFLDYVRQGKGLLAIHSGTADYREAMILRGLLGGVFTHHPPQCPVTVIPQKGHPLTGCPEFTEKDEHYFMAMDDPGVEIFLTTASEHGAQPGGWTRLERDGRVCVLTPGHNEAVWLHPSFQTILCSALNWCAKAP